MNRVMLGRVLMALGVVLILAGVVGLISGGESEGDEAAESPAPTSSTTSTTTSTTTTPSTPITGTSTSTTSTTTSTTTTTTSTTTTTTAAPAGSETAEEFLAVLLAAFADADAETLYARLNQATLDRYGNAQCQAYAESVAGVTQNITLKSTAELDSWDYVTDDVSVALAGVTRAEVDRVVNTQVVPQELHWQLVNGAYTWFTDCGDAA